MDAPVIISAATLSLGLVYWLLLRPWHLKWGATNEEFRSHLPGDDTVPHPREVATHAITINAPASAVWPRLVQIGQNKGGFYSYSWLENLVGCHLRNANRILPQFQQLHVGDTVWLHPKAPALPVLIFEPLHAMVLVAADARLLEASSLKCVESAFTGESDAVEKQALTLANDDIPLGDRENMVFMGTSVVTGQRHAVVVATAMDTEIGRIAGLIEEAGAEEGTPLQQKLESFGRILVWASLGIVALLFVLGLVRGMKFFELFMTSVSLAVAAVPEGLPAVVTVSLALGVMRMSRRRALVRKLPAVETLGSTTVICTDKTGTLTLGEMTVRALYVAGQKYEVTGEGYEPNGEVRFEGKASNARQVGPLLELATILVGCNNAACAVPGDRPD